MNLSHLIEQFPDAQLEPYVDAANGDAELAVGLYDWNIQISGEWLEDLSITEVLLRNALDRALGDQHGDCLYDQPGVLLTGQWPVVDEAKKKSQDRDGSQQVPSSDQVVAELPFGFWRSILGPGYKRLWPTLREAFPHVQPPTAKLHQDEVEERVADLVNLRNEIAHHWPIFEWNMDRSIRNVKTLTGSISPQVQAWLVQRSRVQTLLNACPVRVG